MKRLETGELYSYGGKFFSRSPVHSGMFVTAIVLFVLAILGSAVFFVTYWARLPLGVKSFIFLVVCVRARNSMWIAIRRHKMVHEVYFAGEVSDFPPDVSVNVALNVAGSAILDDLFYTSITVLALLLVAVGLLHLAP